MQALMKYSHTPEQSAEFLRLAKLFLGPQVLTVDYTPTGAIDLPLT